MEEETVYWDIFAYGTLRRGFHNHGYMDGSAFLGLAVTVAAYAMYVRGAVPYLLADEPRYRITGELYRVDAATLARLDALEEHPHVYCRRQADIVLEDGATRLAWVYFARRACGQLWQTGDFARVRGFSRI